MAAWKHASLAAAYDRFAPELGPKVKKNNLPNALSNKAGTNLTCKATTGGKAGREKNGAENGREN